MPKISVIMSVYSERVDWIRKSIDSILNQTYSDFEFIIVNDKPNREENAQLLEEYAACDSRIKVLTNEENIGLTKSLNKAFALAEGEFIARMDADDMALPERFKIQLEFMNAHPEIIASGGRACAINEKDEVIGRVKMPTDVSVIPYYTLFASPLIHPASFFRNGTIRYDEGFRYAQDYALWTSLIGNGYKLSNVKKPVLKYRYSDTQIFKKHKQRQAECAEKILRHAFDNLKICSTDELIGNWKAINNKQQVTNEQLMTLQMFVIKFLNDNNNKLSQRGYNYIANRLLLNLILKEDNKNIINSIRKYLDMRKQVNCSFDTKTFALLCLNKNNN